MEWFKFLISFFFPLSIYWRMSKINSFFFILWSLLILLYSLTVLFTSLVYQVPFLHGHLVWYNWLAFFWSLHVAYICKCPHWNLGNSQLNKNSVSSFPGWEVSVIYIDLSLFVFWQLMALLLLRHALTLPNGDGDDDDASTFFSVSVVWMFNESNKFDNFAPSNSND